MKKIKIKSTHGGTVKREHTLDSGFDLSCMGYRVVDNEGNLDKEVWFDETEKTVKNRVGISPNETIMLLTGIQIQLPEPEEVMEDGVVIGYNTIEAQVRGRSGLSLKKNTNVKLGTCDNGYSGMYGVIFHNESERVLVLDKGDKIAQVVFNPIYIPTDDGIEFVDSFEVVTDRGELGFGSSDSKQS